MKAGKWLVAARSRQAIWAVALIALFAFGAFASAAGATPLSMTFTEARANVGVQLSDAALLEPPAIAPFDAQLGPAGESISAGDLDVPQFSTHTTEPIEADVTVDFNFPTITGSFVSATGELTLSGAAAGTLTIHNEVADKECFVSTTPEVLTLSTKGNSGGTNPRSGVPFSAGLTGAGAIAGQWTDMSATPVDPGPGGDTAVCEAVEQRIEGPGGVWLKQKGDVVPPSAPLLTSTDPASPGSSSKPRIRGNAEAGSTVHLYAGSACVGAPVATASAEELGSPGIPVEVAQGTGATFSATAVDAAGNVSACSAPISYTRLQDDNPPPPMCVVPKLAGQSLARAKASLKAANCKPGTVHKPKRRKGKKLGPLVVKSSRPGAGATLSAGSEIGIRLVRLRR